MADENVAQFDIHLRRHDAEIETNVDEDGADRAPSDFGFDFLGRGQAGGILGRLARRGARFGGARLAWGGPAAGCRLQIGATGGAPVEPGFKRGGAEQTAPDAAEDQREIAGTEDPNNEFEAGEEMRGGGVLLEDVGEIFAVGGERVDDAEDPGDARWYGPMRLGPMGIGLDGCDRFGGAV